MGIVGAVGILMAPLAGHTADRRGPNVVIGLGCLTMAVSYVVMGIWGTLAGLVIGVVLLDLGEQAALLSNQHVVYALRPEARSRLNTLFMSGMFLGGAVGSWAASAPAGNKRPATAVVPVMLIDQSNGLWLADGKQ